MKILLIEPYFTGSHKQWAVGFAKYSKHDVRFLTMKGQFWKWRMHGGAVTMAREFNNFTWRPDHILATDMLDLSTFLALTKSKSYGIPTAIYFHENQLSYPWSPKDRDVQKNRDSHYGFINYASALAADQVFFNSEFHMVSFLDALPRFLRQFPDYRELDSVNVIRGKSRILHLGMNLRQFDNHHTDHGDVPLILWNHRWEYDKNPTEFFNVLEKVREYGSNFKLAVMGENFNQYPDIFIEAHKSFEDQIVQWGYTESFTEYAQWLWKADILPVTSNQEFFGASVMEAMYCDTWPLLPNRLTYPELLPSKHHGDHLYSNGQDLFNKINWAIENYEQIKSLHFHSIAKPFDWEYMAPTYDSALEQI